jgi:hypothetical protein
MNAKVTRREIALLCLPLLLVGACLNHPRNNQFQANKSTVVSFDGYYIDPSQVISIYIKNNSTGVFDPIPHAPIVSAAASAALTDNGGAPWYPFSANDVVLPSGSQYWSAGPTGQRVNVAHIKAIGSNPPDAPIELNTFDVTADDCMNTAVKTSGVAVIQNCKSSQSPVVTLNAGCGSANGDCCVGSPACDFGQSCSGGTCSSPCGKLHGACCSAYPWCSTGGVCIGTTATDPGTCVVCGDTGEHCCNGAACNAHNACVNGRCECGGLNQPCCAVKGCTQPGTICNPSGICMACGKLGGYECCANSTCSQGTCVPSTPPQCVCGDLNQACCPGNPPSCLGGTGYTCQNGLCSPPSKPPLQCQGANQPCGATQGPNGTPAYCCPNSGLICNFNKCTPCVAHGAGCAHEEVDICCTAGERCVIDNNPSSNGAAICGNPDPPPNP